MRIEIETEPALGSGRRIEDPIDASGIISGSRGCSGRGCPSSLSPSPSPTMSTSTPASTRRLPSRLWQQRQPRARALPSSCRTRRSAVAALLCGILALGNVYRSSTRIRSATAGIRDPDFSTNDATGTADANSIDRREITEPDHALATDETGKKLSDPVLGTTGFRHQPHRDRNHSPPDRKIHASDPSDDDAAASKTNAPSTSSVTGSGNPNPSRSQSRSESESKSQSLPSPADPTSLIRGVDSFLSSRHARYDANSFGADHLWDLLVNYTHSAASKDDDSPELSGATRRNRVGQSDGSSDYHHYYYESDTLAPEIVCGPGPGRGMEQDAGYKLLAEKIRIVGERDNSGTNNGNDENFEPRVLCIVYTYSPMRYLVRSQALAWGRDCDGFLAYSNETLPALGIYQLPINNNNNNNNNGQEQQPLPKEDYANMWQKVRRIWKDVHDRFSDDYDYFYISGDDVYLLVENLRAYLREVSTTLAPKPRHFGSWLPSRSMVAGGPGYVLNRAALKSYVGGGNANKNSGNNININSKNNNNNNNVTSNRDSPWSTCKADQGGSYEDRFLSYCMAHALGADGGVRGSDTDTRDPQKGAQRFHDNEPSTLYLTRTAKSIGDRRSSYHGRMKKAWADQPPPLSSGAVSPGTDTRANGYANSDASTDANSTSSSSAVVGPLHGLEAAAVHSISLHHIHTPIYMARIHAILRPVCPIDSPLGRGLLRHFVRLRAPPPA